jgi:hypothetical protein
MRGFTNKGSDFVARLRLMSGAGDVCVAEWQPAQPETMELAVQEFTRQQSRGCLAFRIDGPGRTRRIDVFDATAPEILLVPPVQGG